MRQWGGEPIEYPLFAVVSCKPRRLRISVPTFKNLGGSIEKLDEAYSIRRPGSASDGVPGSGARARADAAGTAAPPGAGPPGGVPPPGHNGSVGGPSPRH